MAEPMNQLHINLGSCSAREPVRYGNQVTQSGERVIRLFLTVLYKGVLCQRQKKGFRLS